MKLKNKIASICLIILLVISNIFNIYINTDKIEASNYVTVRVTNMFNSDDFTKFLKKIKFKKVVKNKDYTTTYTMTKKQQKSILSYLKKTFTKDINKEKPKYYKAISANKNFTKIKAIVDKKQYVKNKSKDMIPFGLALYSYAYQQYSGLKENKIKYIILIIDSKTKKQIQKIAK